MRLLPHLLQICVFILISTIASGHVNFAYNFEDFRSLTRQFIPELADQLVGLVEKSKKVEEQINTEEDGSFYKPSQDSEEKEGFVSKLSKLNAPDHVHHKLYHSQNYDQERIGAKPSHPQQQSAQAIHTEDYGDEKQKYEAEKRYKQYHANGNDNSYEENQSEDESVPGQDETKADEHFRALTKKVKTVQVNLDELVEKVKERILSDLKPVADNRGYKIVNSKDTVKDAREHRVSEKLPKREKITRPTNARGKTLSKFKGETYKREPDFLGETNNKQKNPVQGKINNRRPQQPEEETNEKVIEEDNILTKVKLSSGKKEDSYEDYVVPKKDDIFESEEPIKTTQYVKQRGIAQKEKENNFDNVAAFTADRKQTVKDKRTTPEYDESQEKTTEHEMKARTENIGDSRESLGEAERKPKTKEFFKTLDEDSVTNKRQNATLKPKLGTMIPTRKIYKMSSPNYYAKLPRIAEKYNFDEPIPVKDMEPENLKPIGNPPASINRKVKL